MLPSSRSDIGKVNVEWQNSVLDLEGTTEAQPVNATLMAMRRY